MLEVNICIHVFVVCFLSPFVSDTSPDVWSDGGEKSPLAQVLQQALELGGPELQDALKDELKGRVGDRCRLKDGWAKREEGSKGAW